MIHYTVAGDFLRRFLQIVLKNVEKVWKGMLWENKKDLSVSR